MFPVIDFGIIKFPTFFLVVSLIMGLTFYLTTIRSRKLQLDEKSSLDLSLVLILGGLFGARLFHIAFENLDHYLNEPIKVFFFWEGGFVFYGGLIFGFLAGVIFLALKKKLSYLKMYLRLYTPILSISYVLGRIGCFFQGCCYGKFCDWPWSIDSRHPTQIYSSIWELGILFFIINYEVKNVVRIQKNPERLFFIWLLLHSIGRSLIEIVRDDFRGNWPLVSLSTWVSFVLLLISCIYFFRNRNRIPNR